ncbi:MAG: class I SAM-dependent methyltransferase [Bacteroidia bacterium]|nr:class I SAM-dependent methyltransferase [Bacteroidia bacterium]
MYAKIAKYLACPSVYAPSDVSIWNDEHISKQMLLAHLNPDCEGASRKLSFIEDSVAWIKEIMPCQEYPALLDVGCGPGLYAERFYQAGYQVTGIDYSSRSIEYAKSSAKRKGLDIAYVCQDYLRMDYENTFDCATFIYCDYGALSTANRGLILQNIYRGLKKGGKLLFDVFSLEMFHDFQETQTWQICADGGFWSPEKHLLISGQYKYPQHVTLEKTTIITEDSIRTSNIWNTCFSLESLLEEVQLAGFKKVELFGDVAGQSYTTDRRTIAILLEK